MSGKQMTDNGRRKTDNRRRIFGPLSSVFYLLLFCGNAYCGELRFKFQPGDKYSLALVTEQKMLRVVDGNERAVEQTTRLESNFDVEEVDSNSNAWVKYTYKRITMKFKTPEQKMDFDSDANQLKIPMQATPMKMVMGESLYLWVTPQGHMGKINGLASLVTYAKGKLGIFQGSDIISRDIEQQFDEHEVRRRFEDQFAVFPDSNQGGTWSRVEVLSTADIGSPTMGKVEDVNIVFERTFRLNPEKSGRGGIVIVDVNLVIKPAPTQVVNTSVPEEASTAPARASREISGGGTGQVEIEEATGRIINYTMTQDTVERVKFIARGTILRPPPSPEPLTRHIVTSFQMTKVEGAEPTQPADANDKMGKGV
jgi:hypothetical protein